MNSAVVSEKAEPKALCLYYSFADDSIYLLESCKFFRSFPKYLTRNRDVHGYNTRRRNDLHVPAQTLALSRSDPPACMATLYNLLPVSLKAERRYSVFQKRLKSLIYDQRFYDDSEFLAFVNGHI
jgi:hypothetical protein